ncbi:efflux RND transporter periplasmic adaptor subunit [Sporocytophaga myxococcoides]|uniref:efflux RND transporter periplasmic adaptor subunit n=1 Tax=Sporocytophaga myxococcoides TaxID=153721 RepID=UPI0004046FD4|nr:efflux RND transporter periplasmic adaptor subunit [Sporocytophaga myxococcoides]
MRRFKIYFIIATILSALIFIKAKFFTTDKGKSNTAKKSPDKLSTPVSVFVVGNESIQPKVYATGTILANEATELKAEASGRVIYLNLPEGQFVKSGTLLLKVNDAEYQAQLTKLKAQIKLASSNEERQRQLLEINGISKQEYDNALANLLTLRADSAFVQTQIAKTEIRAPFNGLIGIHSLGPGAYITPAITAASIYQVDPVKIEFYLPEKYSAIIQTGDEIQFRAEGLKDVFSAKIIIKDPAVDTDSRSVRYHAICANTNGKLLPGTFVNVELKQNENSKTLFVPTEAIVPVTNNKIVFVVKDGIAQEKIVRTGIRTEDFLQIVSGISVGDSVVINGNFRLKNEAKVKVVKSKERVAVNREG